MSPALPLVRHPEARTANVKFGFCAVSKHTRALPGVIRGTVVHAGERSKMVSTGFSFPVTYTHLRRRSGVQAFLCLLLETPLLGVAVLQISKIAAGLCFLK